MLLKQFFLTCINYTLIFDKLFFFFQEGFKDEQNKKEKQAIRGK